MKLLGLVLSAGLLVGAAGCPDQAKRQSSRDLNAGNKALGQKQFQTALNDFQKAVELNHDNHLAWYGMGLTYFEKHQYDKAADALEHTVQIEPDQAMYQLWYGRALLWRAIDDARHDQARRQNKKPDQIQVDLSAVNFEKPQQHLEKAIKLNKDLWRAHYLLGTVYRDSGKAKQAATQFTKAIEANPREEAAPYVALAELYRKWDYVDQSIAVAQEGAQLLPGKNQVSNVWYELGMGYDEKGDADKEINAFTKALEADPDNHKALFQRGQAYFRKNDSTHAKHDLQLFAKSGGASLEFDKQQANKMLMDIAAKAAGVGMPSGEKKSPQDLVKSSKHGKHHKHRR